MESINTLKGYGKVPDQENQIHHPLPKPSHKTLIITTISLLSLLFLLSIIALTSGAFSNNKPPPHVTSTSLKTVCALTLYQETCLTSLSSSSTKLNPESILKSTIITASETVSKLSTSFRSINDTPKEAPSVTDCVNLYNDALSQLNASLVEIVKVPNKTRLTESVIGDVKTWISAAMTDGETCSDGLEEMGTVVGKEIKKEMEVVNELMSISLAFVTHFNKLVLILH